MVAKKESHKIMKELFLYILLCLFVTSNIYADEIKIKRIECASPAEKNRYNNYFIIIDSNDSSAKLYKSIGKYKWNVTNYKLKKDMFSIKFYYDNVVLHYNLDRETGLIKPIYSTLKQCTKMIDGFDPKEFLDKQIKKNILEKKNNNKF